MFETISYAGTKPENYKTVATQLRYLIEGEGNFIANLSNAAALLNFFLEDINWVGFYLKDETKNELVLGPFQGLPACIRIPLGRGICGIAAETKQTQRIADVHNHPNHITCDASSKSEIVIPMIRNGKLIGVLDIDSPIYDRFDEEDENGLREFIHTLLNFA